MGLLHARPAGALLALEPNQRLGARARYPRLERVSSHLRARSFGPAIPDRRQLLSPGFRIRTEFSQRQALLRNQSAVGRAIRRTALSIAVFVLRLGSARLEGSIRRLLAAKPGACAHQSRVLRRQSAAP